MMIHNDGMNLAVRAATLLQILAVSKHIIYHYIVDSEQRAYYITIITALCTLETRINIFSNMLYRCLEKGPFFHHVLDFQNVSKILTGLTEIFGPEL